MVKIDLKTLFDKRWETEKSIVAPLDEQAKETDEQTAEIEQAWDRFEAFFPEGTTSLERWEVKSHLGYEREVLNGWQKSGSAIFTFRDDLLEMFRNSDIMSLPIRDLRWPSDSFYLYFGDYDPFPLFDPDYRVDGCLVSCESLFKELNHGRVESLDVISSRLRQEYIKIKKHIKFWAENIASWEKVRATHTEAEERIAKGHEAITFWQEREAQERDIPTRAADELARQQKQRDRYQLLQSDPDAFAYDGLDYDGDYLWLDVEFTVIRKDGKIAPLTGAELLKKPYLRATFDFKTHRDTVSIVIDRQYQQHWYGHDHYNMDRWDNLEITDNDPSYIIEHSTYQDGSPRREFKRIETHLNTTNRPEYLAVITSLVFNALCYLDWRDRDVVKRYSDPKLQAELDRSPKKKQERVQHKAQQLGYRKLWFCGFSSPRVECSGDHGKTVATHWRRGHWRRQAWGKGRSEHRLTWIKPVIVKQTPDIPTKPTVYTTAR